MRNKLTQEELKKQLLYDPDKGIFTRRTINHNKVKIGEIAGWKSSCGYTMITVNGIDYQASRLAWLYTNGYFPEHDIDHKNGIRNDDRFCNIRHVSHACNMQNQKLRQTNKSGFPGVSFFRNEGKWSSEIRIRGKKYFLGYYDNPLDAALARYTIEMQCDIWKCDHRSELEKSIKRHWPEFRNKGKQ